jgi:hypothetical protein
MVGHEDEGMEEKLSLTAIVEDCLLKQFGCGRDLKETAALRGYGGEEIGAGFLWREPHLGSKKGRARG